MQRLSSYGLQRLMRRRSDFPSKIRQVFFSSRMRNTQALLQIRLRAHSTLQNSRLLCRPYFPASFSPASRRYFSRLLQALPICSNCNSAILHSQKPSGYCPSQQPHLHTEDRLKKIDLYSCHIWDNCRHILKSSFDSKLQIVRSKSNKGHLQMQSADTRRW